MARPPATEDEYLATILDVAKVLGWRTAHFRPARLADGGWRTAVAGDGAGFPDLVLAHPRAGFVWFVEVKRDDNRLSPAQAEWRRTLEDAGAEHYVVMVPSGFDAFLQHLQHAANARRVAPLPDEAAS